MNTANTDKENGIARQLTAPYSPQQNGVVERRNRTVLSTTRSMMKAMKLPLTFWAEAVRHAIYILNRVSTRALVDKTPYEALYNRKPNLENLRIFGCTAYAKITIPHLKKLDDRSIPMFYLGVEEGSKAYRLYDPIGKKKHVSRDVKFMEIKPWDWNKDEEDTSTQDTFWTSFVVDGVDDENTTPVNTEINDNIDNTYQEQDPINDPNSPITPSTYTYNPHSDEEQDEATISSIENLENGFDHVPVRARNYKEASTDKNLLRPLESELLQINKNNTWTLTTLPPDQKAIGLKWVYKTKRDAEGKIIKYKARLVAKGYVQEQGIDFDEVFAPVARIETVRLILALAAYHGWQVHHLDVKSAFLHGDLKEEVYVTQPEGFIQQGNSGKVYKLTKALYGLRQAPRAWNVKLDQTLKSLDFKKCNLEQAVYTKRNKTSTLIVGVYVDDLIITGTPRKELEVFKSQMEEKFEMSDLGLLAMTLGIEVTQTGGEITIKQTGYINKILKETSMTDSNDTKIPMDPGTKLVKAEDGNSVDATYYRSLIGSLRYLLHTRPDLSYSVGLLSRFMQDPKDHHLKAVKQVIRYIKGTKEHGIIYRKEGGCKIIGYSDSSYGINTDQGKGTTMMVFYFGESPITWCTQKQPTVALSSCESEFMAATREACQALWLKRLLSELTGWEEKRTTLKVDNVSAIALVRNPVFHGRSKHIDIRYHFIRECVENGLINVKHISGELQRADILTKALPRLKFKNRFDNKKNKGTVVLLVRSKNNNSEGIREFGCGSEFELELETKKATRRGETKKRRGNNNKRCCGDCETAKELWDFSKRRNVGEEKSVQHETWDILRRIVGNIGQLRKQSNLILEDERTIINNEYTRGCVLNEGQFSSHLNFDDINKYDWKGLEEDTKDIIMQAVCGLHELRIGSKSYWGLIVSLGKKKHVSRDVKFMEIKPWDWNKDKEDTSTQDTFWTSFVVDGVDAENTTPVNTEINDNIDNTYQEQDPINDPNSPITPSTYTYNPHSDEEQDKAAICSSEILENGFDHDTRCYTEARVITIKQTGFFNKILRRSSMTDSNDTKIPMDPDTKLVKAEDGNLVDATYYRSLIGSLRKEGGCKITGYSDSSYGINTDQGKGTTGIVFYFGDELTGWEEKRITLKVDNISAIALVRNPVFHGRSKHIDIHYHFILRMRRDGNPTNVEHISGELQEADILNKACYPRLKL
ncbi:ribonuclease H-like domain, reverse transcriptase, RNA-dependent DNA polymerase [Tanacetum coccineum]